jgi:hypothetical protein
VANFDFMSMSFTGKFEGPVEKKLRETGEWLVTSTESKFRASGKHYSTSFLLFEVFIIFYSINKNTHLNLVSRIIF